MKTINYTGSSKLISRIVHLLNRKAPLPLDGDGDPDWGTNGQVLSTDGSGNTAWVNQGGGGSGGHTIENTSGTDLPQEDNLQFVGVYTEDDSANDRTKVNIVRHMTAADMALLSSAEKEGFIRTTDEDETFLPMSDEDVYHGSITVKDAIDGKVSKSGDTMTGMLTIDRSADDGTQRCLALRSGSSGITYLTLFDKTNTQLGSFGCNAQNNPVFRTSGGTVKKLSTRTVTTLVNEAVNLAQSGSKTYATLTTTYLSQFDEVTFLCNWGSPVGSLIATKGQIAKTAVIYGSNGSLSISSGSHYGSITFGSGGTTIRNSSSSTMVSLLIEGITY